MAADQGGRSAAPLLQDWEAVCVRNVLGLIWWRLSLSCDRLHRNTQSVEAQAVVPEWPCPPWEGVVKPQAKTNRPTFSEDSPKEEK